MATAVRRARPAAAQCSARASLAAPPPPQGSTRWSTSPPSSPSRRHGRGREHAVRGRASSPVAAKLPTTALKPHASSLVAALSDCLDDQSAHARRGTACAQLLHYARAPCSSPPSSAPLSNSPTTSPRYARARRRRSRRRRAPATTSARYGARVIGRAQGGGGAAGGVGAVRRALERNGVRRRREEGARQRRVHPRKPNPVLVRLVGAQAGAPPPRQARRRLHGVRRDARPPAVGGERGRALPAPRDCTASARGGGGAAAAARGALPPRFLRAPPALGDGVVGLPPIATAVGRDNQAAPQPAPPLFRAARSERAGAARPPSPSRPPPPPSPLTPSPHPPPPSQLAASAAVLPPPRPNVLGPSIFAPASTPTSSPRSTPSPRRTTTHRPGRGMLPPRHLGQRRPVAVDVRPPNPPPAPSSPPGVP